MFCAVCDAPMPYDPRGRSRVTCSHACRNRLHLDRQKALRDLAVRMVTAIRADDLEGLRALADEAEPLLPGRA
jgi:predicted nucleic acid-binding Zn ribbon protein